MSKISHPPPRLEKKTPDFLSSLNGKTMDPDLTACLSPNKNGRLIFNFQLFITIN